MKKIIEELKVYDVPFIEFNKYVVEKLKITDYNKFYETASNAVLIPQLINFLEDEYDIDFIDVTYYVNSRTAETINGFNELIKKSIRTVFYYIQTNKNLDFIPF